MENRPFYLTASDGVSITVNHWTADGEPIKPAGVIQIVHGMAETALRYEETAAELVKTGYEVYAADLRGHGKAALEDNSLGYAGRDGHNQMVRDMIQLGGEIRRQHAEPIPLFLFGHSMGSFLTQKMMYTAPELYNGFLLSGTCGPRSMLAIGERLARLQCSLQGERKPSLLLNGMVFGPYNRRFLPIRTPFDWLSRDTSEVDKYIEDPCCGQLCTAGFFRDFFGLLRQIHRPANMKRLPLDKPVLLLAGTMDPVGLYGKGAQRLIDCYKTLGIRDFTWKFYEGARHELLHETNHAEVLSDLTGWLQSHS